MSKKRTNLFWLDIPVEDVPNTQPGVHNTAPALKEAEAPLCLNDSGVSIRLTECVYLGP